MATDYQTYAIVDISSPVAETAYRAMKLYSKSSLDSSGGGVGVTPPIPHLIVFPRWGGDRRVSHQDGRRKSVTIEVQSILTCRPESGQR